MSGFNNFVPISANVEAAMCQESEGANTSSLMKPKTRNRLSASDRKAKREAVAAAYREGHPQIAIMLRQRLSKPQLNAMLAHLFMTEELSPVAPSYELVTVSTPIKALHQFGDGSVEYVCVEQNEHTTTLTPYRIGDENEYS